MKLAKLISIFVFMIFFISSASAILVYADWEDDSQRISVTQGEVVSFYADFGSINPAMTLNIVLLNSNYEVLNYFENNLIVNDYTYASIYTIDTSSYDAGSYSVVLNGEDERPSSGVYTLDLTIEEEVIVDNNAPIVEILSPTHGNTYTSIVDTLNYIADDPEGNLVDCRYSDGSFTSQWNDCFGNFDIVSSEGENTFTVYARDSYGNIGSDTVTFTVDTNQNENIPIITLIGDNYVEVVQGNTYVDAGATAYDSEDGDLTSEIVIVNPVDTSTIGTYTITYNVEDSEGNSAEEKIRTVVVVEEVSNNIPVITLNGYKYVEVVQGNTYVDAGATAYDSEDGNLTSEIVTTGENINTNVLGTYYVKYNVEDSDGNHAEEVVRIVKVVSSETDTTPPVITVIVPRPSIYNTDEFTFEVLVNEESNVVYNLDNEGNVSMNEVDSNEFKSEVLTILEGNHTVTFYATDLAGNVGSETVEFSIDLSPNFEFEYNIIVPKEGVEYDEEITFKVETNAVAEVSFSLNGEPNITMNYQGAEEGILTFVYSDFVNEGNHEIIFYIEDSAGNIYSETIIFSTDDGSSRKKKDKNNVIDNDFYKDKYLEDLNYVNTPIHLNEEDSGEELTLCQKFLIWFKNTFGFEFFFFMFGLFFLLCILLLIYIFKKYREYYL